MFQTAKKVVNEDCNHFNLQFEEFNQNHSREELGGLVTKKTVEEAAMLVFTCI